MLELVIDNRTPNPIIHWDLHDIPLVKEYTYLGILITDTLKFKIHQNTYANKERELKNMIWAFGHPKLDSKARWHIYQSLYRSKVSYGMNLISVMDQTSREWLKGFTYRALKALLGWKQNINKE